MTDSDEDSADEELGQVSDQLKGIENRFGGASETSDTSESKETTETTDTAETSKMPGTRDEATTPSSEMSETTETTDSAETSETNKSAETNEMPQPSDDKFQLREHWNGRTIYLPDDDINDLDIRYKECSIKWQQQNGGKLPKNEQFYPAVVRAALNETSIEKELDLDEDST